MMRARRLRENDKKGEREGEGRQEEEGERERVGMKRRERDHQARIEREEVIVSSIPHPPVPPPVL